MSTTDTLETLRKTIAEEPECEKRTIKLLDLMRTFIVDECADYNKIGERIHVLRSKKKLTQNHSTSGHDLIETETGSRIEHKSSRIKTTASKSRVNAQITPSIDLDLFSNARKVRKSNVIHIDAGIQSFSVYRPLWEAMDAEIERKMSNVNGGMQVDWYNAKTQTRGELFVSSLVYRLEAARWLNGVCAPHRRTPNTQPSFNIGSTLCKKCQQPHRLARLANWSKYFKYLSLQLPTPTFEELLTLIPKRKLEKFYSGDNRVCQL